MAEQTIHPGYYLPTGLVTDIFLRLPVKTLIRCTSVCKSWYSLIRNPNFVASHLNSSLQNYHDNDYILFGDANLCHVVCDTTFNLLYSIQTPFTVSPNHESSLNFVGSCNGLLCLAPGKERNLGNDVYIWNPSVRTHKKLPPSRFSDQFKDDTRYSVSRGGFGFHELSNDYKVIRLVYFPKRLTFLTGEPVPLVEIYSLRSDSWEIVSNEAPPIVTLSALTFNDGVFYWMGFKSIREDPRKSYIMSYDLDDGEFREIKEPSVDFPLALLALKTFSGSLFAVYSRYLGGPMDMLVLWRMDEFKGGWMKTYTIQCNTGVWVTLGFTRSGKFLFANLAKQLVSFDLESLETEVHDLGIAFDRSALDAAYMESLMFFDH